ncbi:RIP metalloprotease RseP [uncultured Dubosiella sp.]|uniref:RIP metalloprotease RseP n=3 Tax=uncultured Dubosiella sp. TaxID=1937011 RepID=UPI0025974AC0|nr:RIP metalloprotease RseP [uncultured Dubosiella sp.]
MNLIIGLIAFLFMLSVIVIIHELGHFAMAKKFGVFCKEFSIGMGPALWQKEGKETTFSIRAIPFGGYVMMAGEQDGSQDESEDDWLKDVPAARRLNNIAPWKQIVIMLAGVTMNIVLAYALFTGLAMARGYVVEDAKPVVYEVVENSPAAKAGMQKDDEIIRVTNGSESIEPQRQFDVIEFIQYNPTESTYTIARGNETLDVKITPRYNKDTQTYEIGSIATSYARPIAWYEAFKVGWDDMVDSGSSIFRSLGQLVKGKGYENLSGPVGILNLTKKTTEMGWMSYLSLFALISLNIGIFNLLPIPALDGGRVLILLIERITRRKINEKLVENIILASFVLLIGIFLFATYNDIAKMF